MTELLTRCGAYTYFGAHPAETGYVFRVWAPHARAVALAGDFNGWQSAAMTRLDGEMRGPAAGKRPAADLRGTPGLVAASRGRHVPELP